MINYINEDIYAVVSVVVVEMFFNPIINFSETLVSLALASKLFAYTYSRHLSFDNRPNIWMIDTTTTTTTSVNKQKSF